MNRARVHYGWRGRRCRSSNGNSARARCVYTSFSSLLLSLSLSLTHTHTHIHTHTPPFLPLLQDAFTTDDMVPLAISTRRSTRAQRMTWSIRAVVTIACGLIVVLLAPAAAAGLIVASPLVVYICDAVCLFDLIAVGRYWWTNRSVKLVSPLEHDFKSHLLPSLAALASLLPLIFSSAVNQQFRVLRGLRTWVLLSRVEMRMMLWTTTCTPKAIHLVNLFGLLFVAVHVVGCLWSELHTGPGDDFGPPPWMISLPPAQRYGHSLYFALGALTGYGGLGMPRTTEELFFAAFTIIIGFALFASIVGGIGEALSRGADDTVRFLQGIEAVGELVAKENLPDDMKRRIDAVFEHEYDKLLANDGQTSHWSDLAQALNVLPRYLRDEVVGQIAIETIHQVPLFSSVSQSVSAHLARCLKAEFVLEGDTLFRQGDLGRCMLASQFIFVISYD